MLKKYIYKKKGINPYHKMDCCGIHLKGRIAQNFKTLACTLSIQLKILTKIIKSLILGSSEKIKTLYTMNLIQI